MMEKKMLKRSLAVWMVLVLLFVFTAPVALMEGEATTEPSAEETVADSNIINEESEQLLDENEEMLDNVTVEESSNVTSNEETVAEPAAEPASEDVTPAAEEPAAEETTEEAPAAEEPAAEETTEEAPAVEEPAAEETTEEAPAVEEPATEETTEEAPAAEEPAAEETTEEAPTAEEPAAEETTEEAPVVEEEIEIVYFDYAAVLYSEPNINSDWLITIPGPSEHVVLDYPADNWAQIEYYDAATETLLNGYVYCLEEAPVIPDDAEHVATLEDALAPECSIDIYVSWGDQEAAIGNTATMYASLNGYDNVVYYIQWQTSKDGSTWADVEGAMGYTLPVTVTMDNYLDYWRVVVTVTAVKE